VRGSTDFRGAIAQRHLDNVRDSTRLLRHFRKFALGSGEQFAVAVQAPRSLHVVPRLRAVARPLLGHRQGTEDRGFVFISIGALQSLL
jgi:hypothetical protein